MHKDLALLAERCWTTYCFDVSAVPNLVIATMFRSVPTVPVLVAVFGDMSGHSSATAKKIGLIFETRQELVDI